MAEPAAAPSLLDRFSALEDPRQRAKVLYPLPEILLLLLCATLAGADDLVEITLWGEEQLSFLRRFLPYRRGMVESATERDGRIARERRYYLGSARLDAVSFAQAVRAHWGIENRLTGSWMSSSTTISQACGPVTHPKTWPWSGTWR